MCASSLSTTRSLAAVMITALAILAWGGACDSTDGTGGGGGNGNGGGGGTDGVGGVLLGQVSSVDGDPIAGVAVSLANGRSASTEDNGIYSFSGLTAGETIVTAFRKSGFAATVKALDVAEADSAVPARVIMVPAANTVTISADDGATQRSGDSAVTIPPGSLVDADGNPVTGDVELTATFIDPSTDEVEAFPGSFDDAQTEGGEDVTLESFGFAIYELTQDGEEINLAPGSDAEIEYVLPDNAQDRFQVGDTIPLWEFDEETATWIERGQGEVGVASDGSGRLAWFATVDHFSSWNCDVPIDEKSCVSGRVISDGEPVVGAEVVAYGVDYNGTNGAHTDADGMFCIDVKRDSTVRIDVRLNAAAAAVATRQIVIPDYASSCNEGICEDTGDIELELDSCVRGRVVADDGGPMPLEVVYVAPGVTAVTDIDGYFCARAPANTSVYVFAENRPSVIVTTPASGSCAGGGCVEANLTITLPGVGDTIGTLDVSKEVIYSGLSGVPRLIDPSETFSISGTFLVFDPGLFADISFSGITIEEEPFGECTVRTITIDTTSMGNEEFDAFGFTGIGALDPGNPGQASNGTVTVNLVAGDPFTDFDFPMPAVAGIFGTEETHEELLDMGFDAGQTITFSFPGGADIGAFETGIDMPPDLDVTAPNLADPDLTLDFGSALDLEWVPGVPSEIVVVDIVANDTPMFGAGGDDLGESFSMTFVTCEFPDIGSGTIPAEVMARLPAASDFSSLSVARTRQADADAPLNRVAGNGMVEIVARAGVSRSFFSYVIPDIDDLFPDDFDPDDFDPDDLLPDGFDPDDFDPCELLGITCAEDEVCNTDTYPFTCVPAEGE